MRTTLSVLFGFTAVAIFVVTLGASVYFDVNCGDYLKRAGDANTVELAEANLARAVSFAEKHDLTQGNSSFLPWDSPSNDIGFWYKNLSGALGELRSVHADATQLEKSNLLLKLRETLLDSNKEGTQVTVPSGIEVFPFNRLLF